MGDPARFREFAKVIAREFPTRSQRIADVAGGKGMLQAALRCSGYGNIVTFDKRRHMAKRHRQKFYRYEWFAYNTHRKEFGLVVGMHPDQGTDHAILYAVNNCVPFAVCPCCIIPSASTLWEPRNSEGWLRHLTALASETHEVTIERMPINGKNVVMIGRPK